MAPARRPAAGRPPTPRAPEAPEPPTAPAAQIEVANPTANAPPTPAPPSQRTLSEVCRKAAARQGVPDTAIAAFTSTFEAIAKQSLQHARDVESFVTHLLLAKTNNAHQATPPNFPDPGPSPSYARAAGQPPAANPGAGPTNRPGPRPTRAAQANRRPEAILKTRDIPQEKRILAPALVNRINEATMSMPNSTKAIATRTLPSGDTAIVFERSNDEGWFRKDDTWARRALSIGPSNPTPFVASGPKVVIWNINAKVLTSDLTEVHEELANTANITITELRPRLLQRKDPRDRLPPGYSSYVRRR